jgi:CheY-like chemotaxis protein
MSDQEKIEAYLSSVRHELRSQLTVVREGTSMILEGLGDPNCNTCHALLKPALESTDQLNRLIGELLSTARFNKILAPLILVREEELKSVKRRLLQKEEELKNTKDQLLGRDEELKGVKRRLLQKEEELKNTKGQFFGKEEELKSTKIELRRKEEQLISVKKESPENDLEVLTYELTGMISHTIRTPLAVVKESLSLVLDQIPGELNAKQRELLTTGKKNIDSLIQSVEELSHEFWDEILRSAKKDFSVGDIVRKDRPPQKKRILIVEDQAVISNMLKMRLEANNYEIILAGDGEEGLEKARKENPNLIILDIMLPKMHGYKVCQLLKADPKYNTIPIIISSGRTPQEVSKVGKEVGADAFVSKPFEAEVLLSTMKGLLEKKGK